MGITIERNSGSQILLAWSSLIQGVDGGDPIGEKPQVSLPGGSEEGRMDTRPGVWTCSDRPLLIIIQVGEARKGTHNLYFRKRNITTVIMPVDQNLQAFWSCFWHFSAALTFHASNRPLKLY